VNRYDEEDDDEFAAQHRRVASEAPDREFTLGTSTIVGIFFALALGAAVVFGVGYTIGRKSAQNAAAATAAATTPDTSSDSTSIFGPAKPAAGSQSIAPSASAAQPATDTPAAAPPAAPAPAQTPQANAAPPTPSSTSTSNNTVAPADRVIVGDKPATTQPATPNPQTATSFMVQVAAVSSQDVANILLTSLQKKGYTVAVHHDAQDNLLHVQIGPFAKRADAEAMRQKVLADGFNAIVK
jgi:cell division septation protein DedD